MFTKVKAFYEKHCKLLMLIPMLLLVVWAGVLFLTKEQTGEYIEKDVSLKGGLFITIETSKSLDVNQVSKDLQNALDTSVNVKELRAVGTSGTIGYNFEVASDDLDSVKKAITSETGLKFVENQYTIEETSATLSEAFWQSTTKAIALAFVFMSVVVFLYFRKLVPSVAVILGAVSNLLGTIALINVFDIKLSTAGVASLLMLIGYSVDTNILLSTKVLRRVEEHSFIDAVYSSIRTGLTMQATALIAFVIMFVFSPVEVLKKIAIVLIIGMLLDILNSWVQNVGLLKFYLDFKEKQKAKREAKNE